MQKSEKGRNGRNKDGTQEKEGRTEKVEMENIGNTGQYEGKCGKLMEEGEKEWEKGRRKVQGTQPAMKQRHAGKLYGEG